eukprot:TRINITY_DN7813_c0_g1_i1.p1 TRINITY_DN7813_c0_g1~~TRINITY_DN7813_c0_g1_i1.p1  ORF type:complete len:222 (+),score=14.88 TRINITY_DN7813_c0_g1_i1:78-743(+)
MTNTTHRKTPILMTTAVEYAKIKNRPQHNADRQRRSKRGRQRHQNISNSLLVHSNSIVRGHQPLGYGRGALRGSQGLQCAHKIVDLKRRRQRIHQRRQRLEADGARQQVAQGRRHLDHHLGQLVGLAAAEQRAHHRGADGVSHETGEAASGLGADARGEAGVAAPEGLRQLVRPGRRPHPGGRELEARNAGNALSKSLPAGRFNLMRTCSPPRFMRPSEKK